MLRVAFVLLLIYGMASAMALAFGLLRQGHREATVDQLAAKWSALPDDRKRYVPMPSPPKVTGEHVVAVVGVWVIVAGVVGVWSSRGSLFGYTGPLPIAPFVIVACAPALWLVERLMWRRAFAKRWPSTR